VFVLGILACLTVGCAKRGPSHVEVRIDSNGQCLVDGRPFSMQALQDELQRQFNLAGGECSLGFVCGLWDMSLRIDGSTQPVDCSRPTIDVPEIEELQIASRDGSDTDVTMIDLSAEGLTIHESKCALAELDALLKDRSGTAMIKTREDTPMERLYRVLRTCELRSLKTMVFRIE
jgi:hypothetical protein